MYNSFQYFFHTFFSWKCILVSLKYFPQGGTFIVDQFVTEYSLIWPLSKPRNSRGSILTDGFRDRSMLSGINLILNIPSSHEPGIHLA